MKVVMHVDMLSDTYACVYNSLHMLTLIWLLFLDHVGSACCKGGFHQLTMPVQGNARVQVYVHRSVNVCMHT